jgi:hypothetical protein
MVWLAIGTECCLVMAGAGVVAERFLLVRGMVESLVRLLGII